MNQQVNALKTMAEEVALPDTLHGEEVGLTPQEFPLDALPKCVADVVAAVAEAMAVPLAYAAAPVLPLLASCIGATHALRIKRTWQERPILWVMVVGNSGTGKSHPLAQLAEPLIDLDFQQIEANRQRKEAHQEAMTIYAAEKKEWELERKRSNEKREQNSEAIPVGELPPPEQPAPPREVRAIIQDTTLEELMRLHEMNPRGLLVYVDEADAWMSGFNAYRSGRGGDEPKWLSIHSGKSVINDRKSVAGSYTKKPNVNLVSTIQPGTLARSLTNDRQENGLAGRFLFVMPPERERQWTDCDVSPELTQQLATIYQRLTALEFTTSEDETEQPRLVQMDKEATRLWVEYYDRNGKETRQESDSVRTAVSKMPGQLARIALVLHCTQAVWSEHPPDTVSLDAATMRNAIRLVEYFTHEARRVHAMFSASPQDVARAELVELIRSKGGSITVRELMQARRKYRKSAELARAVLDDLVGCGFGSWETRGRTDRFQLQEAVTVTPDDSHPLDRLVI